MTDNLCRYLVTYFGTLAIQPVAHAYDRLASLATKGLALSDSLRMKVGCLTGFNLCEHVSTKNDGEIAKRKAEERGNMRWAFVIIAPIFFLTSLAFADPAAGTREEAVAMVKRVQEKFAKEGPRTTFDAITNSDEFHDRDL